jgi:UTP--glucose-1-phosphate uridylyltransferase
MEISKVIIPAAGLGTRFLPCTKAVPKEMLPLGPFPAMHLIAEEALAAALTNFLIITGKGKEAISDYFDTNAHLEQMLDEQKKLPLIQSVSRIVRAANFTYIRQPEPLGLGHAVWMARHSIGKEYCAIMLPDDIICSQQSGIGQLLRIARQEKTSVIAVQEVPADELSSYGVISIKKTITPNLFQVGGLVEKPQPKDAPSNLAVVGRYVLSHKIFPALDQISSYATQELQLTDAINCMLHTNERVFAYKIQGTRHDIGTPLGWLKANIHYGLQNPAIAHQLRAYMHSQDLFTPFTNPHQFDGQR